MPVPEITHLQFLVVTTLLDGEQSGRYVRDKLAEHGIRKNGPSFYQLMARLEDARLVEGWYDTKVIDGHTIKERRYRVTAHGITTGEATWDFYQTIRPAKKVRNKGLSMA